MRGKAGVNALYLHRSAWHQLPVRHAAMCGKNLEGCVLLEGDRKAGWRSMYVCIAVPTLLRASVTQKPPDPQCAPIDAP